MAISLDALNDSQRAAVSYSGKNHCQILAGAGSGKTRVLTHRIAWLVSEGVRPSAILAITFTNKAAKEMRERALALLSDNAKGIQLSTFHAFGARFLRKYADYIGLESTFTIYDDGAQKTLIKNIMERLGLLHASDIEQTEARKSKKIVNDTLDAIMTWKESGLSPESAKTQAKTREDEANAFVYEHYEKQLINNNAIDFAGLLLWPLYILKHFEDVRDAVRARYRCILVDEFQDTNGVQLDLLKQLCGPETQLTVVGDDDQSIYTWRGADPTAILEFEKRFGTCEVFKLEQNYRSTQPILECAGNLIACNRIRTDKRLWTAREGGEKVHVIAYESDWDEGEGIVNLMLARRRELGTKLQDIAILYRKNSESVSIERACTRLNVPYQMIGSVGFFEREEIVDLMSFLRVLVNPADMLSLQRMFAKSGFGVGAKTAEKVIELIRKKTSFGTAPSDCLRSVLEDIVSERCRIPRAGVKALQGCQAWLNLLDRTADWKHRSPRETLEIIIDETHYYDFLKKLTATKNQEFTDAQDRIKSLFETLDSYQSEHPNDLAGFIEEMSLVRPETDDSISAVSLMTIHASKGLEFDIVFIAGAEEGMLPLERGGTCDIEEERRLMYVAITRAKRLLYISHTEQRHEYGRLLVQEPSRFIDEMTDREMKYIDKTRMDAPDNVPAYSKRPQLAWSSRTKKSKSAANPDDIKKYYDESDTVKSSFKRRRPGKSDDFQPDSVYEDESHDIYEDIKAPESSSSVSRSAESAAKMYATGSNGLPIQVGTKVMHSVHGAGRVTKLELSGNDCKAYVQFERTGQRTIMARFLKVIA